MTAVGRLRRRHLLFAGMAAAATLPVRVAVAADAPYPSWNGLGSVTMRGDGFEVRIVLFDNDELLAEYVVGSGGPKYLTVRPSGTNLYFGLPTDLGPHQAHNPFMHFDLAFAVPLAALAGTYPDGPGTIPMSIERRTVDVEHRSLDLETRRVVPDTFSYTVDGPMGRLRGEIALARPPAWPAETSLDGWSTDGFETFDTIGLARSSKPVRPSTRFEYQRSGG